MIKLSPLDKSERVAPFSRFLRRHGYIRLDEMTLSDLTRLGLLYNIRFNFSIRELWSGPWRLDRKAGQWRRRYGRDSEFVRTVSL